MVKGIDISRVRGFIRWEPYLADFKKEQLAAVPVPEKVCGRKAPKDLNDLTLEELAQLWTIADTRSLFTVSAGVLLRLPEERVLRSRTLPMLGLTNMVVRELERITELFERCGEANPSTSQEIRAGVDKLNFGVFGIADWYAKRMGMTDHDQAFRTKWIRIWQCMYNDARTAAYQRRLNDIMTNDMKQRIK